MAESSEQKERPILFSGAMVRAILDGSKTQTRRVVKVRRFDPAGRDDDSQTGWCVTQPTTGWTAEMVARDYPCPYGRPGDRLWVRETWLPDAPISGWPGDVEWNGCGRPISGVPDEYRSSKYCIFAASWDGIELDWRPSIHMPRWASRITLELTDVRVQRVQEISAAECYEEGLSRATKDGLHYKWGCDGMDWVDWRASPMDAFHGLWNTLNEKRGFGWDVNPWVWALTFKRVDAPSSTVTA